MTPIADSLLAAKALIDTPDKWCKGKFSDGPRRCMVKATSEVGANSYAIIVLRTVIGGAFIADWNDAPERTHAEVMAAFDRAIALAGAAA